MPESAIYLTSGGHLDTALQSGLEDAGCQVHIATSFSEALQLLRVVQPVYRADPMKPLRDQPGTVNPAANSTILVATVRAGAIPLLTLLREQSMEIPPSLILDEDGNDVHTIIRALQLGVREYVLASDPDMQRRLSARLLAERVRSATALQPPAPVPHAITSAPQPSPVFEWDPIGRVIHVGESHIRLSTVEGHIFDLLLANRNRTVPVAELVQNVLLRANLEVIIGARRLRPHVMRLRRKLEHYPILGMRIVNTRGAGYMLI